MRKAEGSASGSAATLPAQGAPSVGPDDAGRDDLRLRVLSSLVLIPLAVGVVWFGGPVFSGAVAAGGVILAREWTRMADPDGPDLAFALAAAAAAGGVIAVSMGAPLAGLTWVAAASVGAGILGAWRGKAWQGAFGALYLGWPCLALVWMRLADDPEGGRLIALLFAAVWGADIGAYAMGKLVGGPRLPASVSPNKTYAGLAGGIGLAAISAIGAAAITGWPETVWIAAFAGIALGAAGLFGDLLESVLKRNFGVKDSGGLIPGHGGLLDRVDGLLIAALVLAAWTALAGGSAQVVG